MKDLTRHLWRAVALLLIAQPASAGLEDFAMLADCPPSAPAGSTILVDLKLENWQCLPINVRVMSSIAGNANQSVGGIGIFGPVVATTIAMPAATSDLGPGTCELLGALGYCSVDFNRCTQDSDCACQGFPVTPAIENVTAVQMPPALPSSLDGTVATFILVAEADDGFSQAIAVKHCLVEVSTP